MKYIIIKDSGLETPIVFPNFLLHKDVAANAVVVSAGECSFYSETFNDEGFIRPKIKVKVWGMSIGLNIPSRTEDSGLIEKMIGY